MPEENFILNIWYGEVKIEQRVVPFKSGFTFECRSRWYDSSGNLVKTTPWESTGLLITYSGFYDY